MNILEKFFGSEDPNKEIKSILEHGKSLLEKNFYDWAAVEFNKALELDPKFASVTITKLFQEMQGGGNPDGIISLGVNVLKIDPKNVELANLLGNTYRKKHHWNHAKNMYKHCLKHDSNFKYAIYNLAASIAKVEIADGQAISAISEFEKLNDFVLPENKDGIEKLIEIQKEIDLIEKKDIEITASELEEESKDSKQNSGKNPNENENENENEEQNQSKLDKEDQIDSLKIYKYLTGNLKEGRDFEKDVFLALGLYSLQKKEKDISQSVFKRLLMFEKGNTDFRCFLILSISLDGEFEKAIKTLQHILGKNPNHRYTNVNIGILLKNKGLIQQSRVSFFNTFKLLERSQGEYDIKKCLERAKKLYDEDRKKKALEIYDPLVDEISSENLLLRIAKLNLNNKSWDNALKIFKKILNNNRQNNDAREGIKTIYSSYLIDSEDFIKKKDPKKAAELIDKALGITLSKNLIQKAISINRLVENENRVIELEKLLNNFLEKRRKRKIEEKIVLAEKEEKKGNFKKAISLYEEAIKMEPKNSTLKKMVDFCVRIERPELVEKFTNWFLKLQKTLQEKEKTIAREAFEISKKKEEDKKD